MSRVSLAVYDLSHGMAAQMSQAILGQRIDGIWHTGIVVFGNEYFFGGGIQVLPFGAFGAQNGMQPVQLLDMGTTNKSQQELENHLRTINSQFTQATYDLINNNCNNFADNVCNFLTGHGIPDHIVNLPRIVFSTPGGAMLRPMIEGMQNNIRQQGSGMDPFGAGSAPTPSFESSLSNSIGSTLNGATSRPAAAAAAPLVPSKANLEEMPLISGDTSTVRVISNKILNLPVSEGAEKGSALSAEEKQQLELILARLTDKTSTVQFSAASYALIERLLAAYPATHMSCLFILRLMLLVDTYTDFNTHPLLNHLLGMLSNKESGFSTIPAYAMGICSLSNYLSHSQGVAFLSQHADAVVDVVLSGLSHERSEIRQMSVTLAYNFTLACTREGKLSGLWATEGAAVAGELSSQALQLLCCCLEGIITEADVTVRRRRLAVVCRLFRGYGRVASDFVSDLGFADVLQIMNSGDVTPKLSPEEVSIVRELVSAFR